MIVRGVHASGRNRAARRTAITWSPSTRQRDKLIDRSTRLLQPHRRGIVRAHARAPRSPQRSTDRMEAIVARSIEAFDRDEWNALFADELEDWVYYHAVERAGLPGFEWLYFGSARTWANCAPRCRLRHRLPPRHDADRPAAKRVTDAIARVVRACSAFALLSLGSPVGEICHLGFAPDCRRAERKRAPAALLARLKSNYAEQQAHRDDRGQGRAAAQTMRSGRRSRRPAGLRRSRACRRPCSTSRFRLARRTICDSLEPCHAQGHAPQAEGRRRGLRVEWRARSTTSSTM